MPPAGRRRRALGFAGLAISAALSALGCASLRATPAAPPGPAVEIPSPLATWPWPRAARDVPHAGVTHWIDPSSKDGTVLDLLQFDFTANPRLRLELYDQDEDDPFPFDNNVDFWARGVGPVTRDLNRSGRGPVIAAWNGLFFDSAVRPGHHVAPIVLRGEARYNIPNPRWTFGVTYPDGRPRFNVLHSPSRAAMAREFEYASGGAQCVVREGAPLKLRPRPPPGTKPPGGPVRSTPAEAGYIRDVDHLKTSRTSLGWSRDSRDLFLLVVKEPDSETASLLELHHGLPGRGGWSLADLQRFWLAKKVWGAVNLDGGDVTQMVYRRADGRYEMVPPRWASGDMRRTFAADFTGAPQGGTMMYFYVRENRR